MSDRIGRFEVRGRMGAGAMGSVVRAWDPRVGREVAIKLLRSSGDRQRRRFLREAEALASLRHANIVGVQEAGETERGQPYLVLDLVPGPSLGNLLAAEGPLPPQRAVEIVWALLQGLAHAHARGVLHRDLKPDNVLMTEGGRPLLTDFGLAKELDADRSQLTLSGHAMGSPGFWPPEQARGDAGALGPHSDVYGMGALLYALLTGRPPIEGGSLVEVVAATLSRAPTPPSALRPEVDGALEAIVLRCLEKEPDQRYATAQELADALDTWLLRSRQERRARWPFAVLTLGLVAAGLTAAVALRTGPVAGPTPPATPAPTEGAPPTVASSVEPAPKRRRLWPLEVGGSLRYRVSRQVERRGPPTQVGRVELVISQRLTDPNGTFSLTVEALRIRSVQDGVTVFDYDSGRPAPSHAGLHRRVEQRLIRCRPELRMDLASGRVRSVHGVPSLVPDEQDQSDPASQLIAGILGVLCDDGVQGWLQTAWHVLGPTTSKGRWATEGPVASANGVRYPLVRRFKPRGQRAVVVGRAAGSDAVIPSRLHRDYAVGDLSLRGSVRFSERGLEESRMVLNDSIVVGNYPGPRQTTVAFARLD